MDSYNDGVNMRKGSGEKKFYTLLSLPAVAVLVFLFAIPLVLILSKAFWPSAEPFIQILKSRYTYTLLFFSLKQSLISAALSIVIALPFSYYYATYSFKGRKFVLALSALSFTIPSILVVLAFVIFYGNNGVLNSIIKSLFSLDSSPIRILYTFGAIILAHVYLNLPVAFNLITNGWTKLARTEEIASYTLKKGNAATFFSITLVKLKSVIINAFVIIFLFCFSSFAIVMVLGGSPEYSTLEAEIYRRAHISLDYASASALAIFSFLITSLLLLLTSRSKRKEKIDRRENILKKASKKKTKVAIAVLTALMLLFILPPLLSILYRSFFTRTGSFSLSEWEKVFSMSNFLSCIISSLIIATIAATLSVLLSETIAFCQIKRKSRALSILSSLPLATGSVMLGLGFNFLASRLNSQNIAVNYILVILTHLVITIPFATRTLVPGVREIPEEIARASYTLRKGCFETFRLTEHRMISSYRRKAFIFAFALSLGEVNATLTLAGGRITTLPVMIYRLIGAYNYQGASVLGSILLLLALFAFLLGEYYNTRGKNELSRSKRS